MDKSHAFKILNLDEAASFEEAKAAYRALAKKYHPDRASVQTELSAVGSEKMQDINLAFSCLAPYLLKKKKIDQENCRLNKRKTAQEETDGPQAVSPEKNNKESVFYKFFNSIKKFATARPDRSKNKAPSSEKAHSDLDTRKTRPTPAHASFGEVFQKVHPKSKTVRPSHTRKKKVRTTSNRSPYQGYQTYMALKKKVRSARKRSNDSMTVERVEKITPVRPVDRVAQNKQ